jgi:hypothetical protein
VIVFRAQHGHALVVRSKGGTQVHAEQTLLHQDESNGLHRAHDQEDDRQVDGYVHGEQGSLSGPVLPGPARQSPDPGHVDAERLDYQHREEQKCLAPVNDPEYSAAETCLARRLNALATTGAQAAAGSKRPSRIVPRPRGSRSAIISASSIEPRLAPPALVGLDKAAGMSTRSNLAMASNPFGTRVLAAMGG